MRILSPELSLRVLFPFLGDGGESIEPGTAASLPEHVYGSIRGEDGSSGGGYQVDYGGLHTFPTYR